MVTYENGRLPDSALAPIPGGRLEKEAAAAWNAMCERAKQRGLPVPMPDGPASSYRTILQQEELKAYWTKEGKPDNAATPGKSNHGRGLAVDCDAAEHQHTIDLIGEPFGWSKKWSDAPWESWHYLYKPGIWHAPAKQATPKRKSGQMKYQLMQDTITPTVISGHPWAVAGYGRGNWPDYPAIVRMFPRAHHLLIGIRASEGFDFDAMDCEAGDETIAGGAAWLPHAKPINLRLPCGYASASNVEELIDLTISHGLKREEFFVWSAHYNYIPHICGVTMNCGYPKADFTQFNDHEFNRNIDGSYVPAIGVFKDTVKPLAPFDPNHYLWFASGVEKNGLPGGPFKNLGPFNELDERRTAQKYDIARMHKATHAHLLGQLEEQCFQLAMRINTTAHDQERGGKVPWNDFRRFGWREQQLLHRSDGKQLVAKNLAAIKL